MRNFLVSWEIEIAADSHEAAAREALLVQLDAGSIASVFQVIEFDAGGGAVQVDLQEVGYGQD